MSMTGVQQRQNFYVEASAAALEVMSADDYFTEALPTKWLELIERVADRLKPVIERAQFETRLTAFATANTALDPYYSAPSTPKSVRDVIFAEENRRPSYRPSVNLQEFGPGGRPLLQSRTSLKHPSIQPQAPRPAVTCREADRADGPDEFCRPRPRLVPH